MERHLIIFNLDNLTFKVMTNNIKQTLKKLYDTTGIPDRLKQPISFLRQWLNEDRKCDPQVTTQELWHWLEQADANTIDACIEVVEKWIENKQADHSGTRICSQCHVNETCNNIIKDLKALQDNK